MKTAKVTKTAHEPIDDFELEPEYRIDYSKSIPNPFAKLLLNGSMPVVLDKDVAKVFQTSEQVNTVLRALIGSMPKSPAARKRKSASKGTAQASKSKSV